MNYPPMSNNAAPEAYISETRSFPVSITDKRVHRLKVEEVIQLAKAGITVDMDRVDLFTELPEASLEDRLYDRWDRGTAIINNYPPATRGFIAKCMQLSGHYIYTMVAPFPSDGGADPVVIKDEAFLFPSDTLMAAIRLMLQTRP